MANRKLGKPTDQRKALLRNQVTNLIWYGRIETTLARAKEVSSMAERLITLAARFCRLFRRETGGLPSRFKQQNCRRPTRSDAFRMGRRRCVRALIQTDG